MTDDKLLPFCFPAVCRKKITAAFDGGRISAEGGLMLLAQADRRLGIAERLAQAIPDARDPDRVTQDRCLVDRRRRVLAMVLQDGGDRVVGAGAEHQRASAGGLDPRGVIALDQPEDADAGAEPLLRMRPRAQDHIGQDDGVVADRGGLSADALMRAVAIAPVRARHVLGDGGRPVRAGAAPMAGDPLAAMEDLDRGGGDARLDLLADQLVRHAVVMLSDLDVVVEVDPAALPLGVFVGFRRQPLRRRPVELLEERPPAGTPAAHRPIVEIVEQGAIAALRSASEKKRRCRSRARIQRPTTWTPTSTLALSRGL